MVLVLIRSGVSFFLHQLFRRCLLTPFSHAFIMGQSSAHCSPFTFRAACSIGTFYISLCRLPAVLSITSPPQATQRTLSAVELDEIKRKHQHSLVIQRERIKEEQTRKYGAPLGQAVLYVCSLLPRRSFTSFYHAALRSVVLSRAA